MPHMSNLPWMIMYVSTITLLILMLTKNQITITNPYSPSSAAMQQTNQNWQW